MELFVQKALAATIIVILSAVFGFLPLYLARRYDLSNIETIDPEVMKKEKKKVKNVALSFLLNLGGGVLLANCFCHWLPEVREGIEHTNIDTFLPLAEVIMCAGFFFICGLEELLHHFLHPHQKKDHHKHHKHEEEGEHSTNDKETSLNSQQSGTAPGMLPEDPIEDAKNEKSAAQVKAAIRTVFVVLALSFHSVIEGLALSLENESGGVWLNTGATALHKFVISFSVGVELVSNKVSTLMFAISILVFSLSPAIGSAIGIWLTESSIESTKIDLPLQILQGVATGTIMYVVFFEIFPKAKGVGGTGKQHIIAMVIGFALFLPSLYFHGEHENEEGIPNNCTSVLENL